MSTSVPRSFSPMFQTQLWQQDRLLHIFIHCKLSCLWDEILPVIQDLDNQKKLAHELGKSTITINVDDDLAQTLALLCKASSHFRRSLERNIPEGGS